MFRNLTAEEAASIALPQPISTYTDPRDIVAHLIKTAVDRGEMVRHDPSFSYRANPVIINCDGEWTLTRHILGGYAVFARVI